MASRIVIACDHDRTEPHPLPNATQAYSLGSAGMAFNKADMCEGGRVLTEGEYVLAAQTCSECGGSFGQCFQAKIKCCPDCNHFPNGRDLVQWWDALAGGEQP